MDLFLFPARGRTRVKSYYFFVVINVRGEEYNRRSFATSFKADCYAYVDINSSKKKKKKFKEREYNIEIFIVKKKCIPQNGTNLLFFIPTSHHYYIISLL